MGSTTSTLEENVYDSISKYTTLTRSDIEAWEQRFLQQCQPDSNKMTRESFSRFYCELRPTENVKRLSESVFRAFDLDGDQGISFSEVFFRFVHFFS